MANGRIETGDVLRVESEEKVVRGRCKVTSVNHAAGTIEVDLLPAGTIKGDSLLLEDQ